MSIIIFYIVGLAICLYAGIISLKDDEDATVEDMLFVTLLSIFSWCTILGCIINYICHLQIWHRKLHK